LQGHVVFSAKNVSQDNGLVKSSLPKAASMKRNGNKKVVGAKVDVDILVNIE
jgi:hypothetical protein